MNTPRGNDSKFRIQYAFSARCDGDMRQKKNIQAFLKKNTMDPTSYVMGTQIHGTDVFLAHGRSRGRSIHGKDGFVANTHALSQGSMSLVVKTADCIPILFYDAAASVVGAAHSGWRGTKHNIVQRTVDCMRALGASLGDIRVAIGPHIRACCYSVGDQRIQEFLPTYGERVVRRENGISYLNLTHAVRMQLQTCSIGQEQVEDIGICTACRCQEYFSYRKDSHETFGEQIGIISLAADN